MDSPHRISRQICMDEEVYKDLTSRLVLRIIETQTKPEKPWVSSKEAMNLLNIKDERTLSKYCEDGGIRVASISGKHSLYHRDSILSFIEQRAQ